MIITKLAVEKLKAKGIDKAEETLAEAFKAIQESVVETAVHPEAEPVEKGVCAVLGPVLEVVKPQFEKLIDFDKDGKVG